MAASASTPDPAAYVTLIGLHRPMPALEPLPEPEAPEPEAEP